MTATATRNALKALASSAPAVTLDETEAAAAEALAPMPADLVALRERKLKLAEQRDLLNEQIDEIKGIFATRLVEDGLQGYVLAGKVHARRSLVRTSRLDSKKLKEKHPRIFAAFQTVTETVRINIT